MLHVKIDDELKKQLEKEASDLGLKLGTYVRMILIKRGKESEK